MATTALTLITRSMVLIGSLEEGETPSGSEAADAFITLNDLISELGLENLTVYTTPRALYGLTANVQSYTIGPGGTFNQARPISITTAGIITSTGGQDIEIPIDVLTLDQWQRIQVKSVASGLPVSCYYDKGFASGLATITLYPVPNASGLSIALYTPTALTAFAALGTSYTFPPGYEKMLRYNLAVELCPEFGRQLDPVVAALAESSKGNVKRANIELYDLRVDDALITAGDCFNFYTGESL